MEKIAMESTTQALRVLIHAPTAAAVTRARNNAVNLQKDVPDAEVRIIVNADGVAALLDAPRPETDCLTLVCANTLNRIQRTAPSPLQTVPASISAIARMQGDGWCYVRA
jgi:intracellular sulfur oxidation DsrE/DsrF family protein